MKYIDSKQIAEKLGRSVNGIYILVDEGLLPRPVKLSGKNIWREDMIDAAIAKLAEQQGAGWDAPPAGALVELAPPPRAPGREVGR